MNKQEVTITFTIPAEWDKEDFVYEVIGCYSDMAGWDDDTDQPRSELVQCRIKQEETK